MSADLNSLRQEILECKVCQAFLPLGPRPVFRVSSTASILIAGQAPGIRVHQSGIPWNDPSGERLRRWLDMDKETFYDESRIAIVPMGFCYPGTGVRGDHPPRPECAPLWRKKLLGHMPAIRLVLAIGAYAQAYHLRPGSKSSLTDQVKAWRTHFSYGVMPLPNPSPRNQKWFKDRPWFEQEVVPALQLKVWEVLEAR